MSTFVPNSTLVRNGVEIPGSVVMVGDEKRGDFERRTRMSADGLDALVSAAETAVSSGVRAVVVTSGHMPRSLVQAVRGEDVGTLFVPPPGAKL